MIEPGTLWQRILDATAHALAAGALVPIQTSPATIDDAGIHFSVRVLNTLQRKAEERWRQESVAPSIRPNPFLPPEADLVVGDVTDRHIAILNKFNVVEHHLLIITREYERQDTLLTADDFGALFRCLVEYDGLAFYNGGREAGASQQHKHLQFVPLPLTTGGYSFPFAPLLAGLPDTNARLAALPFDHAFARFETPLPSAGRIWSIYADLLRSLGMAAPVENRETLQTMPYSLLATREWMLLIPRTREYCEEISLNSLAFVGSFFVRDGHQLERLRQIGPMFALTQVARPPAHQKA